MIELNLSSSVYILIGAKKEMGRGWAAVLALGLDTDV